MKKLLLSMLVLLGMAVSNVWAAATIPVEGIYYTICYRSTYGGVDNSFYFSFDGVSTGVTFTKNPTDVSGDEYQWSYELVNGGYYFKNKKYPTYYLQCNQKSSSDYTINGFAVTTAPTFPLKTGALSSVASGWGTHIADCCFLGGARKDNAKIVQLAVNTGTQEYGWFTGTTAMPTAGYNNATWTSYVSYTAVGILPEYLPEYNTPLLNAAKAIITKKGVGYPSEAQRAILQAAIDADVANLTFETYKALDNAYNDYLRTDDVVMPEDGKVYAFVNVSTAGVLNYMYQGTDRLQAAAFTNLALLPKTAKFICHEKDGKYAFINSEGKYLVWGNANTGYSGQWNLYKNDDVCAFDVKKLNAQTAAAGGSAGRERGSVDAAFGCLYLETLHRLKTADGTEESNKGTFVIQTTAPDMDGANAPFWDATYSSGFYLYEVNAPLHNDVTFKADAKGTGNYATFYNYYPTAVPAGATAYTASNSATAGYITLDELAEGIIPAKTAVVLKSETLTSATLHTGLQTADIDVSTNILQGTLMDDFNPGNIYVLSGTATEGVGFYKLKAAEDIPAFRAYYTSTSSAPAFFFGNGPTTAVEFNAATTAAEGKTFDLSGREVKKAARGLYIINGKKVVK